MSDFIDGAGVCRRDDLERWDSRMGRTGHVRSLRTRLLIWRARLSVPTLLSDLDEDKFTSYVTAFNGGLAILTISLFAWLSDLPQLARPQEPKKPYPYNEEQVTYRNAQAGIKLAGPAQH